MLVEIELPWELDQLAKMDILENLGISYSVWVERCYKERMKQILTDPAEFGNLLLEEVKRAAPLPGLYTRRPLNQRGSRISFHLPNKESID